MDVQTVTLPLAFLAGLLSFASPCVLPLVPAYMGYLGGTAIMTRGRADTWRGAFGAVVHALMFVAGFAAVFVLLGASATYVGRLIAGFSVLLQRVGGVLLVVFGMRMMGAGWKRWPWLVAAVVVCGLTFALDSGLITQGGLDLGDYALAWAIESLTMGLAVLAGGTWGVVAQVVIALGAGAANFLASPDDFVPNVAASLLIAAIAFFLNRADLFYAERRLDLGRSKRGGVWRSFLFGVVFAAGWTPCIGPILAAILLVASQLATVGQGILLLLAYSLGLGVPFLIVGLLVGPLARLLRKTRRYLGVVSVISGVLLVLMGLLVFTDSLAFLAQYGDWFQLGY